MNRVESEAGIRARALVPLLACVLAISGCGGGGGDDGNVKAPQLAGAVETPGNTVSEKTDALASIAVPASPGALGARGAPGAPVTAPSSAVPAIPAASVAPAEVPKPAAPAPAPAPAQKQQTEYNYFRLGSLGPAGGANTNGDVLNLDGRQYPGATLSPGSCNVNGTTFTQCSSVSGQTAFTLCGRDGAAGPNTDRIRSRYVLIDPKAERVTDTAALKNLSFDGYENCGQDNVGAQPKGAPSATLSFDAAGNLTLTAFDENPASVSRVPSFFVNLNNDTVSNGVTARFTLYRSNGRYLLIATGVPTSGPTAAEPGTLIAFIQK